MNTRYKNPEINDVCSSVHFQCLWLYGMIKSYEFNDKE